MKKSVVLLLALLTFQTSALLSAQLPVVLDLQGTLGGQPFQLNTVTEASEGGHYLSITRLQYYLSNIVVIHDGGIRTSVTDTHLLIEPSAQSQYSLGTIDCQIVEGIEFLVGVDAINNHLDPSTYPPGHPLGHQSPSMHWGWAAGYRFVVIEGLGGGSAENVTTMWQLHTVGDELARTVTVMVSGHWLVVNGQSSMVIPVRADYENVVSGIDVAHGIINHSNENEAITVMDNMGTNVFSAGTATSVGETEKERNREIENQIVVFPNPIGTSELMNFQFNSSGHRTVVMHDVLGRNILSLDTDATHVSFALPSIQSGLYVITVECSGTLSGTTLVVN